MKATLRFTDGRTATIEIPELVQRLHVPEASSSRVGVYDPVAWPTERVFDLLDGTPDAPIYVEDP